MQGYTCDKGLVMTLKRPIINTLAESQDCPSSFGGIIYSANFRVNKTDNALVLSPQRCLTHTATGNGRPILDTATYRGFESYRGIYRRRIVIKQTRVIPLRIKL